MIEVSQSINLSISQSVNQSSINRSINQTKELEACGSNQRRKELTFDESVSFSFGVSESRTNENDDFVLVKRRLACCLDCIKSASQHRTDQLLHSIPAHPPCTKLLKTIVSLILLRGDHSSAIRYDSVYLTCSKKADG